MMDGVRFDEGSARRIARVVRTVERSHGLDGRRDGRYRAGEENGIWAAKVTARSGTTNATYDAQAIEDASITVSSATPINRLFSTSSFTFNAAAVNDTCLIVRNQAGTFELVILTETIDVEACPT